MGSLSDMNILEPHLLSKIKYQPLSICFCYVSVYEIDGYLGVMVAPLFLLVLNNFRQK